MSEADIERLADRIVEKLDERRSACSLSDKEQEAVRDLIRTKKHAVKAVLVLAGAIALWAVKDAYGWIVAHLTFK